MKFLTQILFTVLVIQNFFPKPAFSDDSNNKDVLLDFQTHIYFWAFNGETSTDKELIEELLDSASELYEAVELGRKNEIKILMKTDVIAQDGPQLLLSLKTVPLLQEGLKQQKYAELNRFKEAVNKVNGHLGEMTAAFLNYSEKKPFEIRPSLLLSKDSRKECLIHCAPKFLGLQNNKMFEYFIGLTSQKPLESSQSQQEMNQIRRRFPNDKMNDKAKLRKGFDPKVASTSDDQCTSACIRDISSEAFKWAGGLGYYGLAVGGPQGAAALGVAGGALGAAIGTGRCVLGPECSRASKQEATNREKNADLAAREIAIREREIADKEKAYKEKKDREVKQKEENDKRIKEERDAEERKQKEAKENEERKKKDRQAKEFDNEFKRLDWANRKKNADATDDTSVSCESTRTCDGTITALVNSDFEKKKNLSAEDLKARKALSSTPMPDFEIIEPKTVVIFDNKPEDWEQRKPQSRTDGNGNIITNWDLSSTPMPRLK